MQLIRRNPNAFVWFRLHGCHSAKAFDSMFRPLGSASTRELVYRFQYMRYDGNQSNQLSVAGQSNVSHWQQSKPDQSSTCNSNQSYSAYATAGRKPTSTRSAATATTAAPRTAITGSTQSATTKSTSRWSGRIATSKFISARHGKKCRYDEKIRTTRLGRKEAESHQRHFVIAGDS